MLQRHDEKAAQPDRQQKKKPEDPVRPEPFPAGEERSGNDAGESQHGGNSQCPVSVSATRNPPRSKLRITNYE